MCTKEQWEKCNTSEAVHAANQFALELEEYARKIGFNKKNIRVRNKEQIVREGFSKADAQVVWEDGPIDWSLKLFPRSSRWVSSIVERDNIVSFYLK